MAYRKKTLRRLPEKTRKLARLIGELTSTTTRLKNYLQEVEQLELDSKALVYATQTRYCPKCGVLFELHEGDGACPIANDEKL